MIQVLASHCYYFYSHFTDAYGKPQDLFEAGSLFTKHPDCFCEDHHSLRWFPLALKIIFEFDSFLLLLSL